MSAERSVRFICGLLSILFRRCKRIVRLHHQIAQKLVRSIDCAAAQDERFLSGVFPNEIESELAILKEVRAKFRHRHALGLRPLNQARESSVVELNFECVLISKLIRKGSRALLQSGFFLFVPFRHETIEHPFGLSDEFL